MSLVKWKNCDTWDKLRDEFIGNEIIYFKKWLQESLDHFPNDTDSNRKVRQLAIAYWLEDENLDASKAEYTFLERARLALQMLYACEYRNAHERFDDIGLLLIDMERSNNYVDSLRLAQELFNKMKNERNLYYD